MTKKATGVTVEKKTGSYAWRGEEVEITDLPGIYSITPSSAAGEDERVARDYILTGETECVVNIIDASNLERNLYLTAQLIEMRVPMLVVVNMLDVAKQHKIEIRLNELEKALGCPVVGIVASRSSGISELKDRISEFLANPVVPPMKIRFDERLTTCIDKLEAELKAGGVARPRWFALQVMACSSAPSRSWSPSPPTSTATLTSPSRAPATNSSARSPPTPSSARASPARRSRTGSTASCSTAGSACRSSSS